MVYVGSKNRISKEIVPIIQKYVSERYLEPFVGGGNIIDKINCKYKIGIDNNKYLIALLNYVKEPFNELPLTISEETYKKVKNNKEKYPEWYLGLVGFCASYGARFFEGFARDKTGKRDIPKERINNLKKQSINLQTCKFTVLDYRDISASGFTIYCDPPYNTKKVYYGSSFDHEVFYDWCRKMAKNNTVLVSSYDTPFKEIWRGNLKCNLKSDRQFGDNKIEKLYIV